MGRVSDNTPLTAGQEAFCQAFHRLNNQTAAYKEAYPKSHKWKPDAVYVAASELMRLHKVSLRIAQIKGRAAYKANVSQERLLTELQCLSYADPAELFDDQGQLIPVPDLPEHIRRAIASFEAIEVYRGKKAKKNGNSKPRYKFKYKFWSKNQAADMIAKHVGLYEADNAQKAQARALELVLAALLEILPQVYHQAIKQAVARTLPSGAGTPLLVHHQNKGDK